MLASINYVLKGTWFKALILFALTFVYVLASSLIDPILSKLLIDDGLKPANLDFTVSILVAMVVSSIFMIVVTYFKSRFRQNLNKVIYRSLVTRTFDHFLNLDCHEVATNPTGVFSVRISSETRRASDLCAFLLFGSFENGLRLIIATSFCLFISWKLTLVLVLVSPSLLLVARLFQKKLKHLSEQEQKSCAEFESILIRSIEAFKMIRIFSLQHIAKAVLNDSLTNYTDETLERQLTTIKLSVSNQLFLSLAQSVVFIFSALAVIGDDISLGDFFAYSAVFWKIVPAVRGLANLTAKATEFKVVIQRLRSLESHGPQAMNKNNTSLQLVSGTYTVDGQTLFRNVNIAIESNDRIYIRGPNGSGKSTLAHILTGLIPLESQENGFNTTAISAQLAPASFLPRSMRDHLRLEGLERAKYDKILAMLRDFRLLRYLDKDPSLLSDGEKKKFMIVLTLRKDAELYIFDEPLATIEDSSKKTILKWIDHFTLNKSLIMITHGDEHLLENYNKTYSLGNYRLNLQS